MEPVLTPTDYQRMDGAALLFTMEIYGKRKLPLSTSPEINDNTLEAWFQQITNYDLAAIRFTYTAAAEMVTSLGLTAEADIGISNFRNGQTSLLILPD